ncbi:MAG: SDR family NAD(P)-dependent oxidoreductase [Candidatus Puniceispirillaceae bacterium]
MTHYFITGASAGIGAALAKKLNKDKHHVSAVARRADRLAALQKATDYFCGYQADVRDASAMAAAVDASFKTYGPIDVAILNAGIYVPQDGCQISPSIYAEHMDVNYMGVVNGLAAIVPQMLAAGGGHIVIISSVAGWRGLPKAAAYGPTKAALISLAESLYFDLTPKNIKIQIMCPGFVDTEATAVNDFDMPDLLSAETAADHIIAGMQRDVFSHAFPKSFTRKLKFLKYLPDRLYFALVGKQTGAGS